MDEATKEFIREFFKGTSESDRIVIHSCSFFPNEDGSTSVFLNGPSFELVFPKDWTPPDPRAIREAWKVQTHMEHYGQPWEVRPKNGSGTEEL